jgi:hypothetical protein
MEVLITIAAAVAGMLLVPVWFVWTGVLLMRHRIAAA